VRYAPRVLDAAALRTPLEEPAASCSYLDRLMRRKSFEALWPLFAHAQKPAKEMTESYSALAHLRPYMREPGSLRVVHVGDGAHCRTGALFSLKSRADSISVDPEVNVPLVEAWRDRFGIHGLRWRKASIFEVAAELNALPPMPTLVTFVHAHVSVDDVLRSLHWDAAFSLSCCLPGKQTSREHAVAQRGTDASVLSSGRSYEVLVNERAGDRSSAVPSYVASRPSQR